MCDKNSELPLILQNNNIRWSRVYTDVRVMNKKGKININLCRVPEKSMRYVSDIWNTLVNMKWHWLLLAIAFINLTAYLTFALLFFLDAWVSGDLERPMGNGTCLVGMHNFTSYFMLGIETITTTGYGYFHPTEFCHFVFIILTCSTMVTIFIDGAFVSVVYAKFGRPRYKWSLFSKNAVVNLRNGKLCFMIRINDILRQHWIDNRVEMFFLSNKTTKAKELQPINISELEVKPYGMIFWPVEVVHEITPSSPLWNISAKDLNTLNFEIVAVLLGSSIQTGQLTRTQTSFLPREIMWGYKFTPCLVYNTEKSEYVINRKAFNKVNAIETPLCSASTLHKLQTEIELNNKRKSLEGFPQIGPENDIT